MSKAEAAARLGVDGPNVLPQTERSSPARLLWLTVREPMVLMLLAAGALYFTLGDPAEALMLMVAVVGVVALTLSQSVRSQRALQALKDLSAPRALVVREGLELRVASAELVVGDLLVLREGDRIAADAMLLHGLLRVDESLLTGESESQQKLPGAQSSALFCGTLVTQGLGWARVSATGERSSMGQIGASLRSISEGPTPLQQASAQLVRRVAALGLAISVAVVLVAWLWDQRPILQSLLLGIATAMAILPEEIPVVLAVFLALGAWRLSQRSVLTRRLSAIETLGSVTVLAVDKTGTLTHNRMRVAALSTLAQQYTPADGPLPEAFHRLAEFARLATPQDPFDPMEKALGEFASQHLARTEHEHLDWVPVKAYELSSDILAMTHAFAPQADAALRVLATKGAPEAVADLCHLGPPMLERIRSQVEALAGQGLRVLGVARGQWQGDAWPGSQHDFSFEFLGLVGFLDPPREDVGAALAQCQTAGIRQGRLIDRNLRRAMAFVFAVHVPIVSLSLAPVVMHWPILLLPAQIVLMELLIDPACSVFFEAEPAQQDLMQLPPRFPDDSALGLPILLEGLKKGAAAAMVLLAGTGLLSVLGVAEAQIRSTVFLALVLGSLAQLVRDRRHRGPSEPANPWLARILGGVALMLGLVLLLPPVRSVVGLDIPSAPLALTALALGGLQWVAIGLASPRKNASRRRL